MIDNTEELCDKKLETIISSVQNNDAEAIKNLFSTNAINSDEAFDEKVNQFISFFEGEYQQYENDGLFSSEDINYGKYIEYHRIPYDVFTTKYVYRIAFKWYSKDDYDNNNLGISSLYVKRVDLNADLHEAYWGDVSNTLGLHIENLENA
jgi:hypothetical protein